MKKSLLYLFMLVCSVSLFMSCSDDEDEVKYPIDTDLAGGYVGNLSVNVDGIQMGTTENQKITISQSNKGTNQIALSLKNFTFLINVGDVEVDPCMVKAIDGGYSFAGQQNIDFVQPLGNCPVSISGTVKGSNINIEIGVEVGAPLNQNVKATFVGSKLTGNESSEAKITSFTFDNNIVTEQPVVDDEQGVVTFKVSDTAIDTDLSALIPTIVVSQKAKITPASGVAQDFSGGKKVTYTVVAEDGTSKVYVVSISGKNVVIKYDFEEWSVDKSQSNVEVQYPVIGADYKNSEWATCNAAVMLIKSMGAAGNITYTGGWPVNPTTESHSGTNAIEMISVDTKGGNILGTKVPKVTAGTAFLGKFNAFAALQDPMATTAFGVLFTEKPIEVKGYFSYTPGDKFYRADGTLDEAAKDTCAMSAVLYEVSDEKETLNGSTIYTSEKIVAQASYFYAEKTDGYLPFELNLEYVKKYDANKKYKFAIIFSASKDGAAYNAAVGSRLLIDDVTVINEGE